VKTATKTLLCGALLASVLPAIEHTAQADPTEITVLTASFNSVSGYAASVFSSLHTFGTTSMHGLATYPVHFTSGFSARPGWTYEMVVDFSDYDPGFFVPFGYDALAIYLFIKEPGTTAPISEINVKDGTGADLAYTGMFNLEGHDDGVIGIHVDTNAVIAGGFTVTIQWNQVPAPGALALLGVAGLVGKRRRR